MDDRYRVDELIGRGGTADVHRGTDLLLGREVAIKVFDARLTGLNSPVRQRSEMRALSSVDHPHLVTVFDARVGDGERPTYLVMELVDGATLADRLADGPIPAGEIAGIGVALAGALAAVHAANLVHRDIKPANVLTTRAGEVKLADFGLARQLDATSRVTTGPDTLGTAAYFSPEQACGQEVGAAGDVYALGLVLLECLTGHQEFPGGALQAAVARLLRDPVISAGLPEPWPGLLTAMTAREPARRPTALQVGQVLGDDPADLPGPPDPATLVLPAGPRMSTPPIHPARTTAVTRPVTRAMPTAPRRRRRAPWAVLAGAVAAIGLTLALTAGTAPDDRRPLVPAAPAPTATPAVTSSAGTSTIDAPTSSAATTPTVVVAADAAPVEIASPTPAAVAATSAAAPPSAGTPAAATVAPAEVTPVAQPAAANEAPAVGPPDPSPATAAPAPVPADPAPVDPPAGDAGNGGGNGNGNAGGKGNGTGEAGGNGNVNGNGNGNGGGKPVTPPGRTKG
nr:serine/threonine-protein kinase [Nakamurella flavida]